MNLDRLEELARAASSSLVKVSYFADNPYNVFINAVSPDVLLKLLAVVRAAAAVYEPLDEPCHYDHHGYCQAHFVGAPCSVAALRDALAALEDAP